MNSKKIGNQYEREFSYKLSEWLTGEKDSDVCWRDLGSGQRFTKRKGKQTSMKGDIVCQDLAYKSFFDLFFIDTKTYKEFNAFIINKNNIKSNDIFQEWLKVCNDCPNDMIPLMPCKIRDRSTPEFVVVPSKLKYNVVSCITYLIDFNSLLYEFNIVLQDEFFKLNDWKNLINTNKIVV